MKNLNSWPFAKNPMMICLLMVAFFCSSFNNLKANPSSDIVNFSKEELFDAIYFLEGDLVSQVPVLRKLNGHLAIQKTSRDFKYQEDITNKINQMVPDFMDRLYNVVVANDHYAISKTVKEGGDLFMLAAAKVIPEKPEGFPNIDRYDLTKESERRLAINAISANWDTHTQEFHGKYTCGIIAIFIYVAVAAWEYFWIPKAQADVNVLEVIGSDESISHERLVNQLATLR